MRSVLSRACFLALGLSALALPAAAQQAPDVDVAFNVGVTSDYIFRGFSQSDEGPALQGGVDFTSGAFYGGAWASTVDFGDDTDAEVDLYGGFRTEASGYALDFGVIGYFYVNEPSGADYNYVEFNAAASRAIDALTVGAAVYWSPDFYGVDEQAVYLEANAAYELSPTVTLSGAVGRQWLDVNADYATWNAGAVFALTDAVALDLRYHGSEDDGPLAGDRFVAGIKLSF